MATSRVAPSTTPTAATTPLPVFVEVRKVRASDTRCCIVLGASSINSSVYVYIEGWCVGVCRRRQVCV